MKLKIIFFEAFSIASVVKSVSPIANSPSEPESNLVAREIKEFDCQHVIAAWEKLGKRTAVSRTDITGCCSAFAGSNAKTREIEVFDQAKVREIGQVVCSGSDVIKMYL